MRETQAIRFAKSVLRENGSEQEFDLEVSPTERDAVAQAFRSLGCSVSLVPHKPWLRITRDEDAEP